MGRRFKSCRGQDFLFHSVTCLTLLLLAACLWAGPAQAGPLKSFEKASTQKGSSTGAKLLDNMPDEFWDLALEASLYGAKASWVRVSTDTAIDLEVAPRKRGEPLIPFVRVDTSYQWVNGGVSAFDGRGELGYAWAGLEARYTSYWDRKTREVMSTTIVEPRLRMSYGSHVEVDLGAGLFLLDGDQNHTGTSFSIPILIHPWPYLGLEYRPAWYALEGNTLRDHTLLARLGWRYVGLLAGYRWVQSGTAALNGPQLGLSLTW